MESTINPEDYPFDYHVDYTKGVVVEFTSQSLFDYAVYFNRNGVMQKASPKSCVSWERLPVFCISLNNLKTYCMLKRLNRVKK